jgi:hypothetical protein
MRRHLVGAVVGFLVCLAVGWIASLLGSYVGR